MSKICSQVNLPVTPTMKDLEKMHEFIAGRTISAAIYVAAKLGIADILKTEPLHYKKLAAHLQVEAEPLYRLLRALSGEGIFFEHEDDSFSLTQLGSTMCAGSGSMRDLIIMCGSPWHWHVWGGLIHTIETGKPYFEEHFGEHFFSYIKRKPEVGAEFNAAMRSLSSVSDRIITENIKFNAANTVVDIGGGLGGLLFSILRNNPHLQGILFDLPDTIEQIKDKKLADDLSLRCNLVSGDFFQAVPAGGDFYILKHVFHGLDNDRCISILRNIKKAGNPKFKLLMVELTIPERNESSYSKFNDLGMMLLSSTGRERTQEELSDILLAAGMKTLTVTPCVFGLSLIQACAS